MTKPIMIQGSMSNVGKSLIAAGLCRIFMQDGYRVAPFKSQNMALNSFITKEKLEMGRAQAVQAEACGIEPSVDMNPILLKPTTDMGSQVIVGGRVIGNMRAMDYYRRKKEYLPVIRQAYQRLASEYEIIVLEGAGSPAEMNLKKDDLVNMGMAKIADAPVLLVGDIDRGGVFAQLLGTVWLLEEEEQRRVKGLIINKFRGDREILAPGLSILTKRCGKEILGVVPYMDVDIGDEDSLAASLDKKAAGGGIDAAVIRLPYLSNFTDLQALSAEPALSVRYVERAADLGKPDLIILPGTKNTIHDMKWLRGTGLEAAIIRLAGSALIFGICGGYQILGESIEDMCGAEGGGSIKGMGLLPVVTYFEPEKTTERAKGRTCHMEGTFAPLSGKRVSGYEIHMGRSVLQRGEAEHVIELEGRCDGCCEGNVFGTYLHGIFDEEEFREPLVELLCERRGISPGHERLISYKEYKERQYDKLADIVRKSLDIDRIYRILEEGV